MTESRHSISVCPQCRESTTGHCWQHPLVLRLPSATMPRMTNVHTMMTAFGREIRLYPNVVEVWQDGRLLVAMTPQEWGEVSRWVESTVRGIAAEGPLFDG